MPRRLRIPLVAAAAVLLIAPAGASAKDVGWRCQAGAVSGSVLGAALDPVTAGALDKVCLTQSASLATALPTVLDAGAVVAATNGDGVSALAVGGVADLKVRSLPTLPIALPPVPIPDSYGALVVPLPSVPAIPLLPSSITLDIRPALNLLLPNRQLPTLDLLAVKGAVAYAGGSCDGATPKLAGLAQVAGVSVLGQDLGVGQVVDQALTLLNTGSIDPSNIDLSLVAIPDLGIPLLDLRPVVEAALDPLLDTLPTIEIPATLAQVRVTPGDQTRTGNVLTQHALRVQASIAGQPLADLTLGRASVGDAGVDCSQAAVENPRTPAEAALACSKRKLALVDVLRRRSSVLLVGAADRSLAGRTVNIVYDATGDVVARAKVASDGSFTTTAPLPRGAISRTNLARYRAVLGDERSLNLKLDRRMIINAIDVDGGRITMRGRVVPPLDAPRSPVVVKRRTSCTTSEVVAKTDPRRDGRFVVSFKAPKGQVAPVYRLSTRVRKSRSNPKTFPTFTLPRPVDLR